MAVKRRSATATLGFAILGPRCSRSAQVGVEELLEARERLVDDGRLLVGLGVEDLAAELSELLFMLWRFGNREAKRRGSRAFFVNQSELKSRLEQPHFRERAKNG